MGFNVKLARLTSLFAFVCLLSAVSAQDIVEGQLEDPEPGTAAVAADAALTDNVILQRLNLASPNCITPRVTGVVRGYIQGYVRHKTDRSKTMLGRRLTYFPLFEQKLKEYELPSDLKFLSVVESALNAKAVSRVGATGLWQFMPATGKEYDLQQSTVVDERSDAVKSTDAAARYLKNLYKIYDDWALALAAYNSGPGRVNAAIKRAHSRNFWTIQRYLPQETRNYVPAFIAASYICNYFYLHEIDPEVPEFDEQLTTYIKVYEPITFKSIADATGVDLNVVRNLNAGFKKDYIPASTDGYYLLLPQRVMPAFIRYLNDQGGEHQYLLDENIRYIGTDYGDGKYAHITVTVSQSTDINSLAEKYGCHAEQLKTWNRLTDTRVEAGQKLRIWRPIRVLKHDNTRIEAPAAASKKPTATKPAAKPAAAAEAPAPAPAPPPAPVWHTVQRAETLSDIARQYNVSEARINMLNKFSTLKVGMRLKISE